MFVKKLIKWYLIFKIVSGILLIPTELGAEVISISLSERKLYLFENEQRIRATSYSVGIPRGDYYGLPLTGKLIEIQINPFWKPTESTKSDYLKKKKIELPDIVLPGHSKNAMGKVKFIFNFDQPIKFPIRLHGTNNESSIGKKASRGCIRIKNSEGIEMAGILLDLAAEDVAKIKGFKKFNVKDKNVRIIIW